MLILIAIAKMVHIDKTFKNINFKNPNFIPHYSYRMISIKSIQSDIEKIQKKIYSFLFSILENREKVSEFYGFSKRI